MNKCVKRKESDVSSLAHWKFLNRKVLEWREQEMKCDPQQSTLRILKNNEGTSIVPLKEILQQYLSYQGLLSM